MQGNSNLVRLNVLADRPTSIFFLQVEIPFSCTTMHTYFMSSLCMLFLWKFISLCPYSVEFCVCFFCGKCFCDNRFCMCLFRGKLLSENNFCMCLFCGKSHLMWLFSGKSVLWLPILFVQFICLYEMCSLHGSVENL